MHCRLLSLIFSVSLCLTSHAFADNIVEFQTLWDVYGQHNLDNLSRTARLPGDLTGDGVPDLLLGSFSYDSDDGLTLNQGVLRVINGADGSVHFSFYGPFAFDGLYSPDVFPGDLNGDGVPDLIASASGADTASGANDGVGVVIGISGADGSVIFSHYGDFTSDGLSGNEIYTADLNSDGVKDIIVSAANADTSEGANDDKGLIRAINGTNGAELFTVRGDFTTDRFYARHVEDVNNDQIPDIIGGTIIGDSSEGANDSVGYIKVLDGATGSLIFKRNGPFEGGQTGKIALVLDDVTGNSNKEIVEGSPLADSSDIASDNVGEVAILDGATGSVLYSLSGLCDNDQYGQTLIVTSDLNGDGKRDFVASTELADSTKSCTGDDKGLITAFNGATGAIFYNLRGDFTNDMLGGSFLTEDITGDSIPDIIAVAPNADSAEGANDDVGLVRAYNGKSGAIIFSSLGSFSQDKLGEQFMVVPDFSGDGLRDVLVSTSDADSAEGANDDVGIVRAINSSTGGVIFEVRGDSAGDGLGGWDTINRSMVVTPDLNLDGVPDVLVSGQDADLPGSLGSNQGVVKLISGADGTVLFDLYGDFSLDRQGGRLLLPGDLNSDGADNIVVCAPAGDTSDGANDNTGSCKAITLEQCPGDPDKVGPGQCGCHVPDTDDDSDGSANCVDLCPTDPNKVSPLVCGCGIHDVDDDGDGTLNCQDLCPADPAKVEPLLCGCGVADTDANNNGVPDCNDSPVGGDPDSSPTPTPDGGDDTGGDGNGDGDVTSLSDLFREDLETIRTNVKLLRKKKGRKERVLLVKAARTNLMGTDTAAITLLDTSFDLSSNLKKILRFSKKALLTSKQKNKASFKKVKKQTNKLIKKALAALGGS